MAARLPGANNLQAFWNVLDRGENTVSPQPSGRFSVERYLHPRADAAGYSYTLAGGYLDHPFDFDADAFGISAREAVQMDPQQRLLMEVVWEALEDAGIPPSKIAGEKVGVYVGASNVDYQNSVAGDQSAIESHFVTGVALSIVSNRISYAFDWKGPSLTIDTACSSSIVALSHALDDLSNDRVPVAVVAGVNLLLSPVPYVGFSRARMLSPTGLCRPFSAAADGYVRSEGAVALVLKKGDSPALGGRGLRVRAELLGAGTNSDGRKNGISVPSAQGQAQLLRDLYDRLEVSPDQLAFVEAHGTGTQVGDPIEAEALGSALGVNRSTPLPVGSVKSNIGHLECASGVAGLAKTILCLENGVVPQTLFLEDRNPNIDFDALNLAPIRAPLTLGRQDSPLRAGVCNYGFGGTNSHVIVQAAPAVEVQPATSIETSKQLFVSAHTREALKALASEYATALPQSPEDANRFVEAVGAQRDWLKERAAFDASSPAILRSSLSAFADGDDQASLASARVGGAGKVALVFSGHGSQWVGMGLDALKGDRAFAAEIDAIDDIFEKLSGWRIGSMLASDDLVEKIADIHVAPALIFGVQSALNAVLRQRGLRPDVIVGHSVGEVAAAEACGALDREQAVQLIFDRSRHQNLPRNHGGMVAVAADADRTRELITRFEPQLTIAAHNSRSSTTISGELESLKRFIGAARRNRVASVMLEVEYPFHSRYLDHEKDGLIKALSYLKPQAPSVPYISSTDDALIDGPSMDAAYWWRNIRNPVHFRQSIKRAAEMGVSLFLEVSARPILVNPIAESARDADISPTVLPTLKAREAKSETGQGSGNPIDEIYASAVVHGAVARPCNDAAVCMDLPTYPWQRQTFVIEHSPEALRQLTSLKGLRRHPLLGSRMADGSPEWRMVLDAGIIPYLSDHRVGQEIVVPGAALMEMALAAAMDVLGAGPVRLDDLDVFRALVVSDDGMREVSVRYEVSRKRIEIWSRRRFADDWTLHAAARVSLIDQSQPLSSFEPLPKTAEHFAKSEIYRATADAGLIYGPSFQRQAGLRKHENRMQADLEPSSLDCGAFDASLHLLDPSAVDAAFHGLFLDLEGSGEEGVQSAFLPVRVGEISVWQPFGAAATAQLDITRSTPTARVVNAVLFDCEGCPVATLNNVYLRQVVLNRAEVKNRVIETDLITAFDFSEAGSSSSEPLLEERASVAPHVLAPWQLSRALCLSIAQDVAKTFVPHQSISFSAIDALDDEARLAVRASLSMLQQADLAQQNDNAWSIQADDTLPSAQVLLATMAERFPKAHADIFAAAELMVRFGRHIGHETPVGGTQPRGHLATFDMLCASGALFDAARRDTVAALERLCATRSRRLPRVLVLDRWLAGLQAPLEAFVREGAIELVIAAAGGAVSEQAKSLLKLGPSTRLIALSESADDELAKPETEAADAIVLGAVWYDYKAAMDELAKVLHLCSSRCNALLWTGPADPALQMMFAGLDSQSPAQDVLSHAMTDAANGARDILGADGFHFDDDLSDATGGVLIARREGGTASYLPVKLQLIPGTSSCPIDDGLAGALAARSGEGEPIFLDLPDGPNSLLSAAVRAERRALRLAGQLKLQSRRDEAVPLWIVTRGAFANGLTGDADADAIWRFGRVAMNEYPNIDIRLVDLANDLSNKRAAALLCDLMANPGVEREFVINGACIRVPRARRGDVTVQRPCDQQSRAQLSLLPGQGFEEAAWKRTARHAPDSEEIEIEVQAVGLNFRDVMLGLGILDEDLLGHGLSSSALGFECTGRVTRVGQNVTDLKVGDAVMGFASDAFSSHLCAPRSQFYPMPSGLTFEAAATVPVAFTTAWYALRDVARLDAGETVLIHGAAGGLGLAAIQIARLCGARVIATAGTEAKRQLVRALGAEAVYNSRNTDFERQILAEHGGVDVVLNSLSGEQMWASLRTLKPFGRFVELGKRDFLENTPLDLRPFLRNRSYFGVDLDELLAANPSKIDAIVERLLSALSAGDLVPLPHRTFQGAHVGEAFRLMQRAEHIGKIVVQPSKQAVHKPERLSFSPAEGVHLVFGGTRGFGFASAMRLLDKGAKKVVLASRSGVQDLELAARIRALGERVAVEKVDGTDPDAVFRLCAKVRETYGPIVGVLHTAMVLEDGFIEGITADALHRVTAPKTIAAQALHEATLDDPLQYFTVYSSATTVIGSPGQAAYVLANGYLEGLMYHRRQIGLPGLAVAWGAISDAGAISRDNDLRERLERTTGVTGVSSGEALDHLEALLARGDQAGPIETYTAIGGSLVADKLAVLATPAFANLQIGQSRDAASSAIDLRDMIAQKSEEEMLDYLTDTTVEEISKILRIPAEAIDPDEPLSVIGMDSLMGLELRLGFESRFGVELPLLAIGNISVRALARKLLNDLANENEQVDEQSKTAEALLTIHGAQSDSQ